MRKILVSAGEASGDLYASLVVEELRRMLREGRGVDAQITEEYMRLTAELKGSPAAKA